MRPWGAYFTSEMGPFWENGAPLSIMVKKLCNTITHGSNGKVSHLPLQKEYK